MPALVGGFGNLKFTFLFNILSYSKILFNKNNILKLNKNYCNKNKNYFCIFNFF